MSTWDPVQYLRFEGERLRPALELLARVELEAPHEVHDLGCGPGTVTRLLARRWPSARVTGVDGSPEMLERARALEGAAGIAWQRAELATWSPPAPAELIYSNAVLHWLDDHERLFPRMLSWLAPGGVLAVQMPDNAGAPTHTCIGDAVRAGAWRARLEPLLRPRPVLAPEAYHEILSAHAAQVDVWQTTYLHALDGEDPVVEWTKGSALRPFLERLQGDERAAFSAEYRTRVARSYPRRADGRTLLAFRRLFLVAVR